MQSCSFAICLTDMPLQLNCEGLKRTFPFSAVHFLEIFINGRSQATVFGVFIETIRFQMSPFSNHSTLNNVFNCLRISWVDEVLTLLFRHIVFPLC